MVNNDTIRSEFDEFRINAVVPSKRDIRFRQVTIEARNSRTDERDFFNVEIDFTNKTKIEILRELKSAISVGKNLLNDDLRDLRTDWRKI